MPARINVVEGVEDDVKSLEPRDVESGVLDVVVIGFDRNIGVEGVRRLFGNLLECQRAYSLTLATSTGARTNAFDFLMCSLRNRNWRLRLLRSMVSRSTMWISPKPERTRFLSSSQPMPPAPTMSTRDYCLSGTLQKAPLLSQSHLFDHAVQRAAEALLSKLVACHCGDVVGFAVVVKECRSSQLARGVDSRRGAGN